VFNSPEALVSICIPTFNRSDFLRTCIESVRAQTYQMLEIIVCDNASTDCTTEMLKNFPEVVLNQQTRNVGMVANWNSAVRLAHGMYCVLLSDDDILEPTFVEAVLSLLITTDAEFAYCPVTIIDAAGNAIGESTCSPLLESCADFVANTFASKRVPYPSAIVFRKESAERVGLFSDIGNQTDVAFRIALAELNPGRNVACLPTPLVRYRIHGTNLTDDPVKKAAGRIGFQNWVIKRYPPTFRLARLACYDLLNLSSKGHKVLFPDSLTTQGGWFGARVRYFIATKSRRRSLLVTLFPVLTLVHLLRLINTKTYHKRFC